MRFNVRAEDGDEVQLVIEMMAMLLAMVGSGENIYERVYAQEGIEGRGAGGAGVIEAMDEAVELWQRAQAYLYAGGEAEIEIGFGGGQRLVTTTWLAALLDAAIEERIGCGGDLHEAATLDEAVASAVVYGAEHHFETLLADEVIGAMVTTQRFDVEQALFDLTIPAGSTLVIDSGGYVVTLDGENVIDRHTGGWLRLDRDVYDVWFEAAGGKVADLEKEMVYTVRWK